jgi:hypothetical protein
MRCFGAPERLLAESDGVDAVDEQAGILGWVVAAGGGIVL